MTPSLGFRTRVSGLLALCLSTAPAFAAGADCRPTDTPFLCHMRSLLSLLDVMAIILGALLLFAVLAAVAAYRRKSRPSGAEERKHRVR